QHQLRVRLRKGGEAGDDGVDGQRAARSGVAAHDQAAGADEAGVALRRQPAADDIAGLSQPGAQIAARQMRKVEIQVLRRQRRSGDNKTEAPQRFRPARFLHELVGADRLRFQTAQARQWRFGADAVAGIEAGVETGIVGLVNDFSWLVGSVRWQLVIFGGGAQTGIEGRGNIEKFLVGPGVFVGFAADRRLRENIVVVELEVVAAGVFAGIVFRLQPVIEEVFFGVVVLVSFAPVAIIGQQAFGPGVILRVVIFDLVVKADLVRGQPVALFHEVAEEGFLFSFFRDEIGVAGVENTAASVFFVLLVFVIKQGRVIIEESVIVDDRFLALFAGFAGFAVDAAHGIGS